TGRAACRSPRAPSRPPSARGPPARRRSRSPPPPARCPSPSVRPRRCRPCPCLSPSQVQQVSGSSSRSPEKRDSPSLSPPLVRKEGLSLFLRLSARPRHPQHVARLAGIGHAREHEQVVGQPVHIGERGR